MKKSVLIRAALLCLLAVPAAGQVPAGPQEKMPLDGEVRVGRLDNGMTYYIRPVSYTHLTLPTKA